MDVRQFITQERMVRVFQRGLTFDQRKSTPRSDRKMSFR